MEPDQIHIRDLLAHAIVGINPDARLNPRDVPVKALLSVDTSRTDAAGLRRPRRRG